MPVVRVVLTNILTNTEVADLPVIKWQVVRKINNTGTFSFTIPMMIPRANQLENYCDADILVDGISIMKGRIDKVQRSMTGNKATYTISGLGEADELARFMAKDTSHYQDIDIVTILTDLLQYAGWDIGDTTTMLDPTLTTTIDLRSEEHILPQIQTACESVSGLFWRYGGINAAGVQTLDFGYFDEQEQIHFAQPGTGIGPTKLTGYGAVKTIKIVENHASLVYEIAGYGGNYTDTDDTQNVITLQNVLDAGVVQDANFPVQIGVSGQLVVRNVNLFPVGGTVRKQFDVYATKNEEEPTQDEIDEAALALYQRCVRYLDENQHSSEEYSMTATHLDGNMLPTVGNRVWVTANAISGYFCDFGYARIPGLQLNTNLRVGEWKYSGSGDNIDLQLKLTVHEYYSEINDLASTYDTLQDQIPTQNLYGSFKAATNTRSETVSITEGPGAASDCDNGGATPATTTDGKLFTVPWPTNIPTWVTDISALNITLTTGFEYQLVQAADYGAGNQLILCVYSETLNDDWTAASTATCTVEWFMTD
jgi:hypothetical protein